MCVHGEITTIYTRVRVNVTYVYTQMYMYACRDQKSPPYIHVCVHVYVTFV